MRIPTRIAKYAGELVQNEDSRYKDGMKAAYNPNPTSAEPASANQKCRRRRSLTLRAAESSPPQAAPANTNPAHGNAVNVVYSPAGRIYQLIHTGAMLTMLECRTRGVSIATATLSA